RLTQDLLVSEALDRFVEWFYRQCTLVLGPTKAVAAALEQKGLEGRTAVWGRGVDGALFTPAQRHEDTRESLLGDRDVLALDVGRVSSDKRVEILLEAARLVERTGPDVRFVVAGDGPARELLTHEAPDNVRFIGEVHGTELSRLYASADLFCFPSTTDTFGQVLLEAAASGLPVIAAAAGGALELVEDGETGLLVPPDDAAVLADAVRSLARHPHRRAMLAAAARTKALDRTWESSSQSCARRTSWCCSDRRARPCSRRLDRTARRIHDARMRKLFLPGYGTSGRLYTRGLAAGWRALEPPPFRATDGAFRAYERWLRAELRCSEEPAWLAGHSMRGALGAAAPGVGGAPPGAAGGRARPRAPGLPLPPPAALPLRKPIPASLAQFVRQVVLGRYELREVAHDLRHALRAPRAAYRLAQAVRRLDLSTHMRKLRELDVPVEVVACSSDTLVTPLQCRRAAELLGGEYRELDLAGGHMWMLDSWPQLARLL